MAIGITARDAAPISEEPKEHLWRWRIAQMANGDRLFCGFRANGSTVRVSSKIVMYDAASQNGMTQSGRIYQLEGPPGDAEALRLALVVWCVGNGFDPAEAELQ